MKNGSEGVRAGSAIGSRQLRVLIADDHAPTRDDVRLALNELEAFSVCAEAASAADAVEQALRERPDICILDVHMPGDGINAAREIHARLPETVVVMFTADQDSRQQELARREGASGFISKSLELKQLGPALLDMLAA